MGFCKQLCNNQAVDLLFTDQYLWKMLLYCLRCQSRIQGRSWRWQEGQDQRGLTEHQMSINHILLISSTMP